MNAEYRAKRLQVVNSTLRQQIDATGYGGWVSDDTLKKAAEQILANLEVCEADHEGED